MQSERCVRCALCVLCVLLVRSVRSVLCVCVYEICEICEICAACEICCVYVLCAVCCVCSVCYTAHMLVCCSAQVGFRTAVTPTSLTIFETLRPGSLLSIRAANVGPEGVKVSACQTQDGEERCGRGMERGEEGEEQPSSDRMGTR